MAANVSRQQNVDAGKKEHKKRERDEKAEKKNFFFAWPFFLETEYMNTGNKPEPRNMSISHVEVRNVPLFGCVSP
jgi:hypothetical protein